MHIRRKIQRSEKRGRSSFSISLSLGLIVLLFLLAPSPAAAWDNLYDTGSSHWRMLEQVIDQVPLPFVDQGNEDSIYALLLNGSVYEGSHYIRRSPAVGCDYWLQAVGSNSGTTHLEYWWQSALCYYRAGDHETAYTMLGRMVHLIQEMGAPPHAYYVMHGESILDQDPFEILSAISALNYSYYKEPSDDVDYPGKNILNEDRHYDDSDAEWQLDHGVLDWTYVTKTNMQVPAPQQIIVDISIEGCGLPDLVYLGAVYEKIDGAQGSQMFGPFSPRCTGWTRWTLDSDTFAPNGDLVFYYLRLEDCCTWWTGQLRVFVARTNDIIFDNEIQKPTLRHPWEYYDWLRQWTLWTTQAPYWREYNSMSHEPARLDFDITWGTAPNNERALLSLQWLVTTEVTRWVLQDAYERFADTSYSLEESAGAGLRVVLYDDVNYNSSPGGNDPAFTFSQSIVCEPYTDDPCSAFIPLISTPADQSPVLDGDFQVASSDDHAILSSDTLGFMADRISSMDVRNARVTLFARPGLDKAGAHWVYIRDTGDLEDFQDMAKSIKIESPAIDELSGHVWLDINSNGYYDAGDTLLTDVRISLRYDANLVGVFEEMPGSPAYTNADGEYSFGNLYAGEYEILVDPTTLPKYIAPVFDLDGVDTPNFAAVTLVDTQNLTNVDFGYGEQLLLFLPFLAR